MWFQVLPRQKPTAETFSDTPLPGVDYQSHDHILQISFHTIVSSVMSSARSIGLFSDRLQMQPAVPLKFDWMILISHVNLELLPVWMVNESIAQY